MVKSNPNFLIPLLFASGAFVQVTSFAGPPNQWELNPREQVYLVDPEFPFSRCQVWKNNPRNQEATFCWGDVIGPQTLITSTLCTVPKPEDIRVMCGPYMYRVLEVVGPHRDPPTGGSSDESTHPIAVLRVERGIIGFENMPMAHDPQHISLLLENPRRCAVGSFHYPSRTYQLAPLILGESPILNAVLGAATPLLEMSSSVRSLNVEGAGIYCKDDTWWRVGSVQSAFKEFIFKKEGARSVAHWNTPGALGLQPPRLGAPGAPAAQRPTLEFQENVGHNNTYLIGARGCRLHKVLGLVEKNDWSKKRPTGVTSHLSPILEILELCPTWAPISAPSHPSHASNDFTDGEPQPPLHITTVLQRALDQGAEVWGVNEWGRTALMLAAQSHDLATVKWVLGAWPQGGHILRDRFGQSLFSFVVSNHSLNEFTTSEFLQTLIEGAGGASHPPVFAALENAKALAEAFHKTWYVTFDPHIMGPL